MQSQNYYDRLEQLYATNNQHNQNYYDIFGRLYVTNNQHTKEKWDEFVKELEFKRFFVDKGHKIFDFIDNQYCCIKNDKKCQVEEYRKKQLHTLGYFPNIQS